MTTDTANGIVRYFRLAERNTDLRTEVLGGITTFFVMAYIIFVNPAILTLGNNPEAQAAGVVPPFAALVTATSLAAGLMTIAMGLYTNYPFALASGLGINAVVAFELIATRNLPWQAAMGVIFIEGLIITILVLLGFRQIVMDAVPLTLKRAISVGIGLFILFIGLVNAGLVQRTPVEGGTPVTLGDFTRLPVLIAFLGLLITLLFMALRVKAALLLGILATTALAVIIRLIFPNVQVSTVATAASLADLQVQSLDFSIIGQGLNFNVFALLGPITALLVIFSLMLSDFFDTMGTIIGVGEEAGFVTEDGRLPGSDRVLLVDSVAAAVGGLFGVSSVTTYIESAAGVSEGARTGLASIVTGLLFLLALFLAPVAGLVPPEATAPALIIVGFLMFSAVREIPVDDLYEGFPALLTIMMMPLTFSITNGIGAGFILYTFLQLVGGRARRVHPLMYVVSLAFLIYFLIPFIEMSFGI